MRDFTIDIYKELLDAFQSAGYSFLPVDACIIGTRDAKPQLSPGRAIRRDNKGNGEARS